MTKTFFYTHHETAVGPMLVAWSDQGVCAATFDDNLDAIKAELDRRQGAYELKPASDYQARPDGYDLKGTPFQQKVWQALRQIPEGHVVTYTELAIRVGAPTAVRAVANACGKNPVPYFVPCHRVIRKDGGLGGYSGMGGTGTKNRLLQMENAAVQ